MASSFKSQASALQTKASAFSTASAGAPPGFGVSAPSAAQRAGEKSALYQWSVRAFSGPVPLALMVVWLACCALLLGRIARSYLSLFRLRRHLHPLSPDQEQRMKLLAETFNLKRRIRLRTSPTVSVPMTIGWLWPLVVLPEALLPRLSDSEFESIVAHELAHIKRWDYLTNLLQRLVQTYLFFHPAVWVIGKQLAVERELACDDWAVKLTGEPRRYASCLTKLAELLVESKPLAMATGIIFGKHVVSRRIEMILNNNRNATTFVSKPALLYAVGLAVLSISVCSFLSPVIAVPLAQDRAVRASTPAPASTQTAKSAPVSPAPAAEPQRATTPTPALRPVAPAIVELDDDEVLLITPPASPLFSDEMAPMAVLVSEEDGPAAPAPRLAPAVLWAPQGAVPAQRAPLPPGRVEGSDWPPQAVTVGRPGERSETPAISESELLSVLSDIVKRDADPNVRNEALQGIYRLRTDAAINTLIQLYDGLTDVKIKGEVMGNLLRRKGDNSKAIAKLVAIAKTEKEEELRGRAISQLAALKGDDGATNLAAIYDSLQDAKLKQRVIRALAYNKSRKAIDKLIQIAKNDPDPTIRQMAVRSLYGIDEKLYLELLDKANTRISLDNHFKFDWADSDQLDEFRLKALEQAHEALRVKTPRAAQSPRPAPPGHNF